jgi:phosphoribosyl 1,2-cyclic phosphodiesterase
MELKVLGSSSAGNCYVFDNGNEILVVECGVPFQDVKKAVNFDISRIVGCLITHEHGDHAKYVNDALKARLRVYTSKGTINAIVSKGVESYSTVMLNEVKPKQTFNTGNFKVLPFAVKHDAAEPFGFLIHHPEMGTVLFATDCNELPYTFNGLNNILIECNHSVRIVEDKLHRGMITEAQSVRTLRNHMSYETCLQALLGNDLSAVNNIVLIHLSDSNSNALDFQQGIQDATGKAIHIATKGMILKFNKTPF